jgi:DNA end-binding protein Ku
MVTKTAPVAPQPGKVINLMDALKRSLAQEKGGAATAPATKTPAAAKGKKKTQAKQDDLRKSPQFKLSIPGGKGSKKAEAQEQPAKAAPQRERAPAARKRA